MSRRDTIIIALLVNAGLLALLFMLAINNEDEVINNHPEIAKSAIESSDISASSEPISVVLAETHVNDEMDTFLQDLAAEETGEPFDEDVIEVRQAMPTTVASKPPILSQNQGDKETRYVEVTVKRGDALEKIARNNGTTVEAIKAANHLNSAKLSIGQVLKIPVSKKNGETAPVAPAVISNSSAPSSKPLPANSAVASKETEQKFGGDFQYYTIKSGDNPWKIAKQFNVKFSDLLRLNNLDEERARNLKVGDRIRVK